MRADHVALGPGELRLGYALFTQVVEHVELELEARAGVVRFGKGPHAEALATAIEGHAGVRAIRPAALGADLLGHARGEGAAEDGVRDQQRDVIVVARVRPEAADHDLSLGAFRLIDDDQSPTGYRDGLGGRIRGRRAAR